MSATRFRRRLLRVVLFGAIVSMALALVFSMRRGAGRPKSNATRVPAGGAAAESDAGSEAIVEDARRYAVRTWSFPLDRYEIGIEDVGMSTAIDKVRERTNAELAINGGFFDPDGKAVGLAISDGAVLSRLGKNLSGGVLTSDGTRAELFASEGFSLPEAGSTARFAVQCRPRLVVERTGNVKSDDGKRAERTALCLRDEGHTIDAVIVRGSDDGESPGPSLFALARHLAEDGCESALNLDGGPSTGAAWRDREGEASHLLAPRGPIRHAITFRKRD